MKLYWQDRSAKYPDLKCKLSLFVTMGGYTQNLGDYTKSQQATAMKVARFTAESTIAMFKGIINNTNIQIEELK